MSDLPDIVVKAATRDRPDDELTLIIGGQELAGWEDIEVTLRAEAFPNSFSVGMSAQPSVQAGSIAGAECRVRLGNDIVISGYIDRQMQAGDPNGHRIELSGRGKTCDLVDCSAEWPSGQMIDGDALNIASNLADAYGLNVELGDGAAAGDKLAAFLLNYGETGAEIIQRVARNAGLLAYEDALGTLILGTTGRTTSASGVVYGRNVQAWSVELSMDGRFSDYVCAMLPANIAIDLTGPGDIFYHRETDPNVLRHRQLDFVLDAVASDKTPGDFTIKRARWEAARRAGRSSIVRATVDSWRDSASALWTPNTLMPVQLPGLGQTGSLALSEVTFRRSSEAGTTADLVLMSPAAFAPEPIVLQPVPADLIGPDQ